jgi:hypothetical protein
VEQGLQTANGCCDVVGLVLPWVLRVSALSCEGIMMHIEHDFLDRRVSQIKSIRLDKASQLRPPP